MESGVNSQGVTQERSGKGFRSYILYIVIALAAALPFTVGYFVYSGPPVAQNAAEAHAGTVPQQPHAGLPEVEEMIARLAARLEANPNDAEGWRMLGWSYLHTGAVDKAPGAYARALALDPDNATYRSAYGEALVMQAGGTVTPGARAEFEQALKRDSGDVRARYFLALALEQDGDKAAALEKWLALLTSEPGSRWATDVRHRILKLAEETGADISGRLPEPEEPPALPAIRGPGPEDVARVDAMVPEDRAAMIEGMVEGLAARLEQNPNDADGWMRLMKSRMVLGQRDKALAAYRSAMAAFKQSPDAQSQFTARARALGILEAQ